MYSHPTTSGNKHIPAGGSSGQILRWSGDGTAKWGDDNNTQYDVFKGCSVATDGSTGLVPKPTKSDVKKFLSSEGTWDMPKSVEYATSAGSASSASKAIMVADYNNEGDTIKIGYDGDGIRGDAIKSIAGYTSGDSNSRARIKDVSKSALQSWLGLGSLAYSSATIPTSLPANGGNSTTVNGHTVNSDVPANAKFTDTDTWRPQPDWNATSGDAAIKNKPASLPASDVYDWAKASSKPSYTKSEIGLGNVNNTADSEKSVKYATSAGSASSATKAKGLNDYNNESTTIKIGYSGEGITGNAINFIAGYTDGDSNSTARIKDVSKSALQSWLGLGRLAYSSATIPTNTTQLTNGSGYITMNSLAAATDRNVNFKSVGVGDTYYIAGHDIYEIRSANLIPNAYAGVSDYGSKVFKVGNLVMVKLNFSSTFTGNDMTFASIPTGYRPLTTIEQNFVTNNGNHRFIQVIPGGQMTIVGQHTSGDGARLVLFWFTRE